MDMADELMQLYPRVFFVCHSRHTRDPQGGQALSQKQMEVLQHLDRTEPVAVVILAKHLGVTPATMSTSLDRLERLGYVRRERASEDRRVVYLRLTEAGERIKQAESVLDRDLVAHLLDQLDEREREAALHGLRLLARAAEDTTKLMEQRADLRRRQWESKWES